MTTPVHEALAPDRDRTARPTRVLTRHDVRQLISMRECIDAVADAFRRHALGDSIAPQLLGTHVDGGGFHVKTAGFTSFGQHAMPVYAAKVNANFPGNVVKHGLPTIQGVIALFDAVNGRLLALLDSIEITSLRTAAASAVAATHLARADASLVTVCGCGEQGRSQLRALTAVRPLRRAYAFDTDTERARVFAREMSAELYLDVRMVDALDDRTRGSDIWVTCTTATRWLLGREHVAPGAFIAAVGADNPDKQEIEPALMANSTVVADVLEQCATIGDLHHALASGVMQRDDVAGELGDVVSGRKAGRSNADQVIVFDSTGTALQDVAVAALVYERSMASGRGVVVDLGRRVVKDEAQWLLLIHQIPPKPDYLRVKIGRRLQQIGAVPVKNSVYVLPDGDRALEDFQWVRAEIVDGGGSGSICRADFVDGLTSEQLRTLFQSARDADYSEITVAARALLPSVRSRPRSDVSVRAVAPADSIARLRQRIIAVQRIDWFAAPQGEVARQALDRVSAAFASRATSSAARSGSSAKLLSALQSSHIAPASDVPASYRGRTWVTRENVFVDRIASAWFIRRFLDADAVFKFVPADKAGSIAGALRFDMFEGEFTHRGDRCTFEVLCAQFASDNAALGSLAEVVHDIDMRDGKFGREDAAGIERVLQGIVRSHQRDADRVDRGAQLFDELYAQTLSELTPLSPEG